MNITKILDTVLVDISNGRIFVAFLISILIYLGIEVIVLFVGSITAAIIMVAIAYFCFVYFIISMIWHLRDILFK